MIRRSALVAVLALVALLLGAPASASTRSDGRAVARGLTSAVEHGRLTRSEAEVYRRELRRTRTALARMSWTPAANLGAVLRDTARLSRRLTRARARILFGELRVNRLWLRSRPMPASGTDVYDPDGVLYRSFPGQGLRFHPLGNFGRLNGLVARGNDVEADRLATALAARGTRRDGTTVWEYTFPFGWGAPPWTSGMAQASAAQTLAWAADQLGRPALRSLARRAFDAIPGRLTMRLSAGPWVRLYSFSGLVVLNAQLQTALSVGDYARRTGDARAGRLAARLRTSSARLLPRFDTGYWSHYSLGNESPLSYHLYVVQLLRKLAERTERPFWAEAAARFHRYTREPPRLRGGADRQRLYPWPVDGFRDETWISFWLSKPSTVTVRLPGLRRTLHLGGGRHRVLWSPRGVPAGAYRPRLSAVDLAGNEAAVRFDPVEIAVDRTPPRVQAELHGRRLTWDVVDRATPWVRLNVRLDRPSRRRWIRLGVRPHSGATRLPDFGPRWTVTLVVADSSRNRTRLALRGPIVS